MMNEKSILLKKGNQSNSVIPDEVIHYNILTRLPLKSVLKFKSVCRSWYNITNSTSFINTHHSYTHDKSRELADFLLSTSHDCVNKTITCFYIDNLHLVSWIVNIPETTGIVGSANGLVCLKVSRGYMLCNPVTKDCSGLIRNHSYQYQLSGYGSAYGFGYDYLIDDYKIVHIKFYPYKGEFEKNMCLQVVFYSTGSNSWKSNHQILDHSVLPYVYEPQGHMGKVVNNKLYWIVMWSNHDNRHYPRILTFDLHTQEIGNMSLPTHSHPHWNHYLMVSTEGHLFTIATEVWNLFTVKIWAMKRYGEEDSWMMCYKINLREELSLERIIKVITYRSKSEGGDELLVLNTNQQLVWYNIENKSSREVDGIGHTGDSWVCNPTLARIPVNNQA